MRAFLSGSSKLDLQGTTLVLVRGFGRCWVKTGLPASAAADSSTRTPVSCCVSVLQPAVAFANIGELSIDLLVCTLKAQPAARLDSDNLLACVGNNAYEVQPPGLLATALELYQVPGESAGQSPTYTLHTLHGGITFP